jgi:hypothetical protein
MLNRWQGRGKSPLKVRVRFDKRGTISLFSVRAMAIPCGNVKTSPFNTELTLSLFSQ